jgi:hypothetical protein
LTSLNRAAPDGSLFQIPAGYSLIDERGPFTVNYK